MDSLTGGQTPFPVRAVTAGPKHHWFGYYDKTPWDAAGRRLLAMESDFADRMPRPEDSVRLGTVGPAAAGSGPGRFEPFAETSAWCWQTGCMLQWLPGPGRRVIYNVREEGRFAAAIHDLDSGARRTLPRPIFCVTPDGRTALSLNFSRLARYRPGYGYEGVPDPFERELVPGGDGVWRMDLATGREDLVLPLTVLASVEPEEDMAGVAHRVNHIQIDPTGARFAVLHRYMRRDGKGHHTRLFTADLDGSRLCLLNPNRKTSHYDWRDADHLLAWARLPGAAAGEHYILFTDRSREAAVVADGLFPEGDGHCSYSPDRRTVVTDSYPLAGSGNRRVSELPPPAAGSPPVPQFRALMLYDPAANRRTDVGRFLVPPGYGGDIRCDLHPRWSRDGRQICFDSVHEGTRQMYVVDVGRGL